MCPLYLEKKKKTLTSDLTGRPVFLSAKSGNRIRHHAPENPDYPEQSRGIGELRLGLTVCTDFDLLMDVGGLRSRPQNLATAHKGASM